MTKAECGCLAAKAVALTAVRSGTYKLQVVGMIMYILAEK
jgi:hypothetical protein